MNVHNTAITPWEDLVGGPRELLSIKEVVTLAEVSETRVRKDIETGLLTLYVIRLRDARLCFHWSNVFAVAAVYSNSRMPGSLRKVALEKMRDFTIALHKSEHLRAPVEWKSFLSCRDSMRLHLDRFLTLDLADACENVKPRVGLYVEGLSRIEERKDILGGEAVFKGSRLPVSHIGKMYERGESIENILEDYPYLTSDDIRFARLYYRAHPPVGRPRTSREPKDGAESTTR
jgi:uncharacterized protein (DUF433 family)